MGKRSNFLLFILLLSCLILGISIGYQLASSRIDELAIDKDLIKSRIQDIEKEREWMIIVDYMLENATLKMQKLEEELNYWKGLYIGNGGKGK